MKWNEIVKKQIDSISPYKPGKPIEEVKRELGIKDIVKLASNESPLGPSSLAVRNIKKALKRIHRYPDSNCYELKKQIVKEISGSIKEENLIIGNGSNEIIELVLRAFVNPQESVISCYPTFLIYKTASAVVSADYIEISLDENLKYDLKQIKEKINDKTKLIFISNPNNPTGTYLTQEELEDFLNSIPSNVIVALDEAYYEFFDEDKKTNLIKYIYKRPLIIMRTFSKAYGLSGLRIGYGIADSECVNYLNRVRQPFNVNLLAQEAAAEALKDKKYLNRIKKLIFTQKQYIYNALDKMKLKYYISQTNFILINVKKNSKDIFDKMLKKGVIIRPMHEYGMDEYIRVTVGTERENKKFIRALSEIL